MPEMVRYRLPWCWEGLDDDEVTQRMRRLAEWVSWLVARHYLAGRIPACWYRHPGLVDELKALWYQYQEVTSPLVPKVPADFPGEVRIEQPKVAARQYREWHEARWRWTTGPLADARGYRECLARNEHVEDEAHTADATAFADATQTGLGEAIEQGPIPC